MWDTKLKISRIIRKENWDIEDILLYDVIEYIIQHPIDVMWWFADWIITKAVLSVKIKAICDIFDWLEFNKQTEATIKEIWKLLNIK